MTTIETTEVYYNEDDEEQKDAIQKIIGKNKIKIRSVDKNIQIVIDNLENDLIIFNKNQDNEGNIYIYSENNIFIRTKNKIILDADEGIYFQCNEEDNGDG